MSETFCRDIICFSVWLSAEGFRACSATACVVDCIKSAIYFSGWLLTTGKIKLKRKPTRAQQGEHGCNLSKVATYELASEYAPVLVERGAKPTKQQLSMNKERSDIVITGGACKYLASNETAVECGRF